MKLKLYTSRLGQAGERTCYGLGRKMEEMRFNVIVADEERADNKARLALIWLAAAKRSLTSFQQSLPFVTKSLPRFLDSVENNIGAMKNRLEGGETISKQAKDEMSRLLDSIGALNAEVEDGVCSKTGGRKKR